MREIVDQLHRLRSRSRLLLVVQRGSALFATALMAMLILACVDYALRFPGAFRLLLLLGGMVALAWWFGRMLLPALGFHPSLTDLALRIERTAPAIAGRLASSVEFAAAGVDQANPLAAQAIRETQERLTGETFNGLIDTRRTRRDLGALGLATLLLAIITFISPGFTITAAQRLLLPLSDAQWPARTGVVSLLEEVSVHPRGQALPLRARATKGDVESMTISARYRLKRNDRWQTWRTITLARQPGQGPDLFESLVDTDAEAIEFLFFTDDAGTPAREILFVPPPAVTRATLRVTPPAYALGHFAGTETELGPGLDARSILETPVLFGSEAVIEFTFNKPLPVEPDNPDWVRAAFGWKDATLPRLRADEAVTDRLTLSWHLTATTPLALRLVDSHGIANTSDITYRIEAVADREPSVTITRPQSDETVTPRAVIALVAEARDDVLVGHIGLEARRSARADAAGPMPVLWEVHDEANAITATIERPFDLAAVGAMEGDVIEITALAEDTFALDGATHPVARSAPRRLRVVTELEFQTELRQQLALLRQNSIRIESQQAELQDAVIDDGAQPGAARAQARVSERLAGQLRALQEVDRRRDINNINDAQLEQLLRDSLDLLNEAGRASAEAAQRLEQRERALSDTARERNREPGEAPAGESGDNEPSPGAPREAGERPAAREPGGAQATQRQPGQDAAQPSSSPPSDRNEQPGQPDRQDQRDERDGERPDQPPVQSPDESPDQPTSAWREPAPEDRETVEQQQRVRDELSDLIELLDRNEDAWVVNQRLQQLLNEQRRLQSETAALNNRTRGRDLSELTELELSELDRIALAQRELEQAAADLIDEARDRARDLEAVDQQAAAGLRDAADTAQREELERHMQQAAQQARDNQLQNAQQQQQQAIDTLQRMQERLNQERARTQELQRRMESLVESIRRLVTVQEHEINALAEAVFNENFSGRDRGLIRLHQNTQAVAGEARSAGQRAARTARALDRAADAQSAAIAALRATPVNAVASEQAQERSLELLKEALAEAERLQQQLQDEQTQQQREELMGAFREVLERQVALRRETLTLADETPLDRRGLVEARRQSTVQEDIRLKVDETRAAFTELEESFIISHVLRTIDESAGRVRDDLREGEVGTLVTDRQQFIADAVARLLHALDEEQSDDESPFDQGQQQQQGEGEQGEGQEGEQPPSRLIPPLAELKLLRGLQEQLYELTRRTDGRTDLDAGVRRETLREIGRRQRELFDLGQRLIEQMQGGGGTGGAGGTGREPAP